MANSIDYIAIQNVLARYCFALDTKDLKMLHQVLTPDIDAQYPFPGGDMQGIEAVISIISKRYVELMIERVRESKAGST